MIGTFEFLAVIDTLEFLAVIDTLESEFNFLIVKTNPFSFHRGSKNKRNERRHSFNFVPLKVESYFVQMSLLVALTFHV